MYEVHSGVPRPPIRRGPRKRRTYPFDAMKVGDMFLVPNKTPVAIAAYVSSVARATGMKFATQAVVMREVAGSWAACEPDDPGATEGVGVWRTK